MIGEWVTCPRCGWHLAYAHLAVEVVSCVQCIREELWWYWCVDLMTGYPSSMPDEFPRHWGAADATAGAA